MTSTYEDIALHVPRVCLPRPGVDLRRWAVIACDQYTSQPGYWEEVDRHVGAAPSTLRLILPEVYLDSDKEEELVRGINRAMRSYLEQGVLQELEPGLVLVDRRTPRQASRKGLVVGLDLEQYDYRPGSTSLIRATEGTIVERLPPRVRVRQDAILESPHIMVLIDDPEQTVIEPLCALELQSLYDFDLMHNGGHVSGRLVREAVHLKQVVSALRRLADPAAVAARYGLPGQPPMLYAMGDGNHSLATAKSIWEQRKRAGAGPDDPARFALVELVNLHDAGLEFEPIHRVLFGVRPAAVIEHLRGFHARLGSSVRALPCATREEALAAAGETGAGKHAIPYTSAGAWGVLLVESPRRNLEVATLQEALDEYLRAEAEAGIDYIHGREAVEELAGKQGNIGFFLPAIDKHDLFASIMRDGVLPRKTFSMGEADEKRFYLECRRIRN